MSADEQGEVNPPRNLPPGGRMMMDPRTAVRGPTLGHGSFDPRAIVPTRIANPGHDSKLPPPRGVPYPPSAALARPPGALQQQQPQQQQPEQNGPKDLMTVKDLMINVIEKSLASNAPSTSAPTAATISDAARWHRVLVWLSR